MAQNNPLVIEAKAQSISDDDFPIVTAKSSDVEDKGNTNSHNKSPEEIVWSNAVTTNPNTVDNSHNETTKGSNDYINLQNFTTVISLSKNKLAAPILNRFDVLANEQHIRTTANPTRNGKPKNDTQLSKSGKTNDKGKISNHKMTPISRKVVETFGGKPKVRDLELEKNRIVSKPLENVTKVDPTIATSSTNAKCSVTPKCNQGHDMKIGVVGGTIEELGQSSVDDGYGYED